MRGSLLLARRYLAHHPIRSAALALGVALTVFLPLSVEWLVARYGASLRARAEATPLVLGAPGSRFDLVLDALYLRGRGARPLSMAHADEAGADGLAVAIPLFTSVTARGRPVVGTSHEYYAFRGLAVADGRLPLHLGECVLGARAARATGLGVGDALLTDRESLYDLARGYPLKLRVAGVLAAGGGPDDDALLCDVRTAWIAAGIGHGHADVRTVDEGAILRRDAGGPVVLGASVVEYEEVTPENAGRFHFHGDRARLPLSAVLVLPRDAKARTLLKGRYRVRDGAQLLEPVEVMGELMALVLRAKAFFDANAAVVLAAAALFLGVVVTLSLAVRARERRTLFRLGLARATVARLMAVELSILFAAGAALAALLAAVAVPILARSVLVP